MISIIKIMDQLFCEKYFEKYATAESELANNNYDSKRSEFLKKLDNNLLKDFIMLEDLKGQVEIAQQDELMQFMFDFCCNLFAEMFFNDKKFAE